jgi:hypothetical protein
MVGSRGVTTGSNLRSLTDTKLNVISILCPKCDRMLDVKEILAEEETIKPETQSRETEEVDNSEEQGEVIQGESETEEEWNPKPEE